MKIERFLYGMQTADGKILMLMTPGVRGMLSQASIDFIRKLQPQDSYKYLWFREEQVIAYPVVITVTDERDPKKGKRTWVQNQTYLVNIHDYLTHTLGNGGNVFTPLLHGELEVFPEFFDPVNV
jgi:hypothetical protein